MLTTADSLLSLVGNTPLVELSRFAPGPVKVYAKLEAQKLVEFGALTQEMLDLLMAGRGFADAGEPDPHGRREP